jgi:predicted Zn-dependent protease
VRNCGCVSSLHNIAINQGAAFVAPFGYSNNLVSSIDKINMSTDPQGKSGTLKEAVGQAMKLLAADQPQLAREQANNILRHHPEEVNSHLVVAAALRAEGDNAKALQLLKALVKRAPDFALAQQELGFALAEAGEAAMAIDVLHKAVAIESKLPACWRLLTELFIADEDEPAAAEASVQFLLASSEDPALVRAVQFFKSGKIGQAERLARDFLKENPTNVIAIRLLADIGIQVGVFDDAEKLLERCLELDPDFALAQLNYADVLRRRDKLEAAIEQIDSLLSKDPNRFAYLVMRAGILIRMGDFDRAVPAYQYLVDNFPLRPKITLGQGHALKTIGRLEEAIDAYRKTIELQPSFGDAYWSLANLKTFRFDDSDIDAMKLELGRENCDQEDYFHLCFALGKAQQDREEFDESSHYYKLGNDLKEKLERYDANEFSDAVTTMKQVCRGDFLTADVGCPAADPIFIVGLPRSGSTLLEQILASHSQVDGTKELMHILAFARRLGGKRKKTDKSRYPQVLSELSADDLKVLGEEYLERSAIQRDSAPNFIDKAPNNFLHAGLINMILPNSKIIDARRHPMGASFSCFTQLFAKGQPFTYGLNNIGRYYCDYVSMMDHWDEVLPGKVLRVQYEDVVNDTESQIRRILDYCGLPFEQNCLEFYRTDRAIRTPSSEQVRQPIYKGGLDMWRNYEPHLDGLKKALEPVLDRYPID